jgi:hypothetical protein
MFQSESGNFQEILEISEHFSCFKWMIWLFWIFLCAENDLCKKGETYPILSGRARGPNPFMLAFLATGPQAR